MQTYETAQRLLTYESDAFGLWRPDAAFRLMQEVAGTHSEMLKIARDDLIKNGGCVWMIARAKFEAYAYPQLHDEVFAKTWYGTPGRTTFPRYVEVRGADGKTLAAFSTSWVIVDLQTRRILPPAKINISFPPAAALVPLLEEPAKLRIMREGEQCRVCRAPQYSDIDVNGHMNNASYVTWIMDLFPLSHHRSHRLQSLAISYVAEAKPGESVEMTVYKNGDAFSVSGTAKSDGHTVFEAQGNWTRK